MAGTWIFLACIGFTLYVIAGYPALLGILSRRSRPIRRGDRLRSVSVVMAVHNGAAFLQKKLDNLCALDYPPELLEFIVVADGCTDNTEEIALGYPDPRVRLFRLPKSGKPTSLNLGISHAQHEILLFTDVRQDLEPASLRILVSAFEDPEIGVISGELLIRIGENEEQENIGLYRRYENWIRDKLSRVDSIFGATGCLYAMRRELTVPIPGDILLDDMYLPLAAFFRDYRLVFEPRARAYDYPTSLDIEFGRKVRTLAGNFQVMRAYPALLGARNRMLFHFLSYKFARLLLPWVLAIAVIASFFLPPPARALVLAAEGVLLLLTLADSIVPEGFPLKRVSSLLRTFFGLMAATMCAISILFVSPQKLWKETRVAAPGRS